MEARSYEFPHNIYFAAESKTWKGKAVAFLDDSEKGFPDIDCFQMILSGLLETYSKIDPVHLKEYLISRVLTSEELHILRFIRESMHGVSNRTISNILNLPIEQVKTSVSQMIMKNILK